MADTQALAAMTHPMEAAAKAVAAENSIDPDAQAWIPKGNEDRPGRAWEMFTPQARAAITAFLDAAPNEALAREICAAVEIGEFRDPDKLVRVNEGNGDYDPAWTTHTDEAEAAIAALKRIAEESL